MAEELHNKPLEEVRFLHERCVSTGGGTYEKNRKSPFLCEIYRESSITFLHAMKVQKHLPLPQIILYLRNFSLLENSNH